MITSIRCRGFLIVYDTASHGASGAMVCEKDTGASPTVLMHLFLFPFGRTG